MQQHHSIGKLLLELQLPDSASALPLQNKLGAVCKDGLLAALQELLDSWADAGTVLHIDRLEINLGECTAEVLERELPERVVSFLRERYPSMQAQVQLEPGMERRPLSQGYFDSWLYFLEHGLLPETAYVHNAAEWETGVLETLATATPALEKCRQVLVSQPAAISRMLLQFSSRFIQQWIQAYAGPAQQPAMQMATAWEEYCYAPGSLSTLQTGATVPSLPERNEFRRRLDEWSIHRILQAAPVPAPATLLEELMELSFGTSALAQYIQALQQTASLPAAAPLLATALDRLYSKYPLETGAGTAKAPGTTGEHSAIRQDQPRTTANPDNDQRKPSDHHKLVTAKDQRKDDIPSRKSEADHITPAPADATAPATVEDNTLIPQTSSPEQASAIHGVADAGQPQKPAAKQSADAEKVTAQRKPGTPPAGLSTYISNAGLVLLHPYLHILFDALGLLEKRAFRTPTAQDKAVQVLGYLANGETGLPEYELVFPKLLCGLLPEDPVDRFVALTAADKKEADELLTAVINNWNALGSTSPDGLRGNFLTREGKLQWQGDEWRLRVTQQSYDLLLNRLPWGLSVVRLPWMPWVLKTEWV